MTAAAFLTRRRHPGRWHWTDVVSWAWLVFGLFLTFTGTALAAALLYLRVHTGSLSPNAAIFDAFCLITGMQMVFFAMWMDMERNKGLK